MPAKIVIAGEGGQGVQVIAKIIAKTANHSEKFASYIPSFGVQQRGGASLAYIQISGREIAYPRFTKADYILVMSDRAVEVVKEFIQPRTIIVYDNSAIKSKFLEKIKSDVTSFIKVPALDTAKEKFNIKAANMIILGVLSASLKDLETSAFEKVISEEFADKIKENPSIGETNKNAFRFGQEYAENYDAGANTFDGANEKEIQRTFECKNIKWTRYPGYCKGCSLCIIKCPVNALKFSEDANFLGNPMPIIDTEKCIGCGKCSDICPDGAIKIEKK